MDAKLKIAHLQMIQGVINRMAGNSFALKGWSVVIISALFALATTQATQPTKILLVGLAYFPALAFWTLDGYFLHQERLFRRLYSHVSKKSEDQIDFSMNIMLSEEEIKQEKPVGSWFKVCLSETLSIFHGTIVGLITAVLAIVYLM